MTCILHRIGISLGWLFNFLGVATASGVFPIALTFLWKDLNTFGAVGGSIGGMFLALVVWLVTCKTLEGEISVDNLASTYVAFAGNATAIILGGVIAIVSGLIWPANFDFDKTRNRTVLSEHLEDHENTSEHLTTEIDAKDQTGKTDVQEIEQDIISNSDTLDELPQKQFLDFDVLDSQYKRYIIATFALLLTFMFIIPISIGAPPYIFSTWFLTVWVIIMYIWLFGSFSFVIIYPLVEARTALWRIAKLIVA